MVCRPLTEGERSAEVGPTLTILPVVVNHSICAPAGMLPGITTPLESKPCRSNV